MKFEDILNARDNTRGKVSACVQVPATVKRKKKEEKGKKIVRSGGNFSVGTRRDDERIININFGSDSRGFVGTPGVFNFSTATTPRRETITSREDLLAVVFATLDRGSREEKRKTSPKSERR